jgi:hypothetical protein
MGKIDNIHLTHLRNDEHFQFFTDVINLINSVGATQLNVVKQFDALKSLYDDEDETLKKIFKSALTQKIVEADQARDIVFSGMTEANGAALKHFNPDVAEAARKLQIVFDTYGNVARKADAEETSAIHNLLNELTMKHANDMKTVGLTPWAEELAKRNTAVQTLMAGRYDENASRTDLVLKQVRAAVDEAYLALTTRIAALALLAGDEEEDDVIPPGELRATVKAAPSPYADFIQRLNAIIARANDILAIRRGIAAAKKKEEEAAAKAAGVDLKTWREMQKKKKGKDSEPGSKD